MTRQKTISSLSIAAIALLAVAVPTFAQAQSAEGQASAIQASKETAVSSAELIAATKTRRATSATFEFERTRFDDSTRSVKQPKLSASDFKASNSAIPATSSQYVSPQLTVSYFVPTDPTAKKQFRSDDYESSKPRKLAFVPSRGQKLPL